MKKNSNLVQTPANKTQVSADEEKDVVAPLDSYLERRQAKPMYQVTEVQNVEPEETTPD